MNKVVHFEIPSDDVERASKFYKEVFGWVINAMPNMGYALLYTGPTDEKGMLKESGFINGGMMKRWKEVKNPVITINVDSIEEAAKKIVANGGKVIREKMDVGTMGYAGYFTDSEGNVMGLWENK